MHKCTVIHTNFNIAHYFFLFASIPFIHYLLYHSTQLTCINFLGCSFPHNFSPTEFLRPITDKRKFMCVHICMYIYICIHVCTTLALLSPEPKSS